MWMPISGGQTSGRKGPVPGKNGSKRECDDRGRMARWYMTIQREEKSEFFAEPHFFWRYQVIHMYFRYFMWNFAGRQNDIQANYKTEINKGNWISGYPSWIVCGLETRMSLPSSMRTNKARNRYFMLPLLIGSRRTFLSAAKSTEKTFGPSWCCFIMTGLAIVVYLNQSPLATP